MRCECGIEYATLSVGDIRYRRTDSLRCPSLLMHESESMLGTYLVCREKQERERNKKTARGRRTQCTNNSDPITSTSELLLRLNSVTAHAH
jgi:hypothetical protein